MSTCRVLPLIPCRVAPPARRLRSIPHPTALDAASGDEADGLICHAQARATTANTTGRAGWCVPTQLLDCAGSLVVSEAN